MDGRIRFSISPSELYGTIGIETAPLVVDVRRGPAFDDDDRIIVGAIHCTPDDIAAWGQKQSRSRPVVVYCSDGRDLSQDAAETLRVLGHDARYLADGIGGWTERHLPTRKRTVRASRGWVTRERPKIDRIACPWLICRFVDPEATFLFVPTERVLEIARETGATAFDIPGAEPFSHDGELCSFDAFLKVYEITDPALDHLAAIVRGADTDRLSLAPQSPGLLAVSLGLSANFPADDAMLEKGMVMYDALYTWCRSLQGETHGWNPELGR